MNAVNLLTMMFAAPAAVNTDTSADTKQVQPGMEFALLLQQQIWMNSSPCCMQDTGAGEAAVPFDQLLINSLTVLADGTFFVNGNDQESPLTGAQAVSGTDVVSPIAVPPSGELLASLVAELKQVLALVEGTTSSITTTVDAGTPSISTGARAMLDLAGRLIETWSQTVSQLNNWLAAVTNGGYLAEATGLNQQPADSAATLLPWSALSVVTADGAAAGGYPGAIQLSPEAAAQAELLQATDGMLALEDGSGSEIPDSIKWFQLAGIVGRRSVPTTVVTEQPPAVTAELPLGEAGTARLILATDQRPVPGSVQSYNLQIDLPGQEGPLTATLTIQRSEAGLSTPAPVSGNTLANTVLPQIGGTAVPQPVTPESIPFITVDGMPVVTPLLVGESPFPPEVAATITGAPVPVATVPGQLTVPLTMLDQAVAQLAAAEEITAQLANLTPRSFPLTIPGQPTGNPVPMVGMTDDGLLRFAGEIAPVVIATPVKLHRGAPTAPMAVAVPPVEAATPPEVTPAVTRTVAMPVAVVPAEAAVVPEQLPQTQNWSADHALQNLGLQPETLEALETIAARPESSQLGSARADAAALTSATQLAGVMAQPQAIVNIDNVPLHLMQFAQAQPAVQPYTGLEYLEMVQKVMEHVNTLRSGSGGFYQARMNLNPPHLGEMFVNISVRGEAVALQMCVVSSVPREQLKDSLDALRQSLEEAGLYVTELRVEEVNDQRDESGGQSRQQQDSSGDEQSQTRTTAPLAAAVAASSGRGRMVPAIGFGN